jgi:3-phenylpropionate/trans-cinnamate dioxygenase ferredoxin reductase component
MTRVVIAGGGLAAQRCCETLRARGHEGPITMVCAEDRAPYDRPPLSKGLLAGATADAELALRPPGWHAEHDVELLTGVRATGIDRAGRRLRTDRAGSLAYDRLLIATGARPRRLPVLCDAGALRPGVHELRTAADARRLRAALRPGARLAVVGAGFVGLEVAATARALGVEVTVVEAAAAPLAAIVGRRVGAWFARLHRDHGVELALGAPVAGAWGAGRVEELVLADGHVIGCDAVLSAVGVAPDTGWLGPEGAAGEGVHVAGDAGGGEHWEAAAREGAAAARAMLGIDAAPAALPSFWSDQHGVRIQSIGRPSGADAVVLDAGPGGRELSARYTRGGRLVGALVAGRPSELPTLRRELAGVHADPIQTRRAA